MEVLLLSAVAFDLIAILPVVDTNQKACSLQLALPMIVLLASKSRGCLLRIQNVRGCRSFWRGGVSSNSSGGTDVRPPFEATHDWSHQCIEGVCTLQELLQKDFSSSLHPLVSGRAGLSPGNEKLSEAAEIFIAD